ncbi:glycosyltransferase family 4 protein [Bradyrhizobium sp. BR13661]|nr:glycosyltransferase family 4 protein [Bradyrhizobium sp. BR13661]
MTHDMSPVSAPLKQVGISAFPLSMGHDTGRGLERVIAELVTGLDAIGQPYVFHDRGMLLTEAAVLRQAANFLWDLRRVRHDVWFSVYPVSAIFTILARKRPVVTGVYDLIPFLARGYDNYLKYSIKRRCIEFACRHSDGLIVPFPSTAEQVVNMFGVRPDRIGVIPLGIDHDKFWCDAAIPKRKFRIGFLGEAKRAKGLDTAILAFAEVAKQNPEAFLAIASGGNELEEMKDLARKNIPPDRYEFVGFVPEENMRQFYSELDLFLFPSRYGFGMSPAEAMACGTPAITGRTLDSTDFFTHELSLVNPNSPAELAARISLLLTDRQRHAELREWALKRVQSLSWTRMAEKYVEFWKQVRDRHQSGDCIILPAAC